jgi:hypothetical protein
MAIRRPSGFPVSIVLSYLEMAKTFATIHIVNKLDEFKISTYYKFDEYLIVF